MEIFGVNPTLSTWLNQIGLILNIVAFVLGTPKLVGIERLKLWEQILEAKLTPIADPFIGNSSRFRKDSLFHKMLEKMSPMASRIIVIVATLLTIITFYHLYRSAFNSPSEIRLLPLILVLLATYVAWALFAFMLMMLFYLGIIGLPVVFVTLAAERIVRLLEDDENLEHRYLQYGALVFFIGTALQLFATL